MSPRRPPGHPRPAGPLDRLRRILSLRRDRVAAELDEELTFLIDARVRDLEAGGWSADAARAEAIRRFGDLTTTRQVCLEADRRRMQRMRRSLVFEELRRDLALAARQVLRRPSFAWPAIATLALGVGAATAIFSAADHILLRPLPYENPDRVVVLREVDRSRGGAVTDVSAGNYLSWKERATVFEAMGLAEPWGVDVRSPDGVPEAVRAWLVTGDFLAALGVTPALGRGFTEDDTAPGAELVAVLSHAAWQRRFGGDPSVVGRMIQMDDGAARVVGVLPPVPFWPGEREVLLPKVFLERELDDRESRYMHVVARLAPGLTLSRAQAAMTSVAGALAQDHPETNADTGVEVLGIREAMLGPVRPALLLLLGAVGLLLLVACANVAGLLLARGVEREQEMAVRTALGAGRGRLARQLLVEAGLLAALGGLLGVGLARLALELLPSLLPAGLPRADAIALDTRVLAFSLSATLVAALVSGLIPALRVSARSPGSLRTGTARGGRSRTTLRRAIVVAQVALATVLLMGGGLLGRSFLTLLENDPGFEPQGRAAIQLFFWDRNPTPESRHLQREEFRRAIAAIPEVEDVGIGIALPFYADAVDPESTILVEGRATDPGRPLRVQTLMADAGFFRVLGIPLVRGRMFDDDDRSESPRVALLNRTAADVLFPGEDPVGRFVEVGVMSAPARREIVGVVEDVRPAGLDSEPRPELFIPVTQSSNAGLTYVVRTPGDAERILPALQQAILAVDPLQTIHQTMTLEGLFRASLVERRFQVLLFGTLSVLSLLLAAVGLYGLVRFSAGLRAREMGVRRALGARGREVVALLVREGVGLATLGVVVGVVAALGLAGTLARLLYGVPPRDPATFLVLAGVMVGVAFLAAWVPARRAARDDVVQALRRD